MPTPDLSARNTGLDRGSGFAEGGAGAAAHGGHVERPTSVGRRQ